MARLSTTVRGWPAMLSFLTQTSPEARASEDDADRGEEVRIGDAHLRRWACTHPEPLRTQYQLALCFTRFGWRWPIDPDVDLVVDPPVESRSCLEEETCEVNPVFCYRDGWEAS